MMLIHEPEAPFGHPGQNLNDTPLDLDHFDDRYEPPPMAPHEEGIVHYGPGDRPLCGAETWLAVHTDDPARVQGCQDCLELVEEDLNDQNNYAGRCLHCKERITAQGGVAWRRVVRRPCPHCGRPGW